MLEWEFAPHSANGNYKLVTTEQIDDEFYLILMRKGKSTIKINLDDVQNYHDDELIDYIKDLYPKILSSVYDVALLERDLS